VGCGERIGRAHPSAATGACRVIGVSHWIARTENAALVDASIAWHGRLKTAGKPVEGDVRFAAVRHDKANLGLWPWGFATWPLDAPVEDFAVALDEVDSTGFVASGEDAAALRALRDQVRTTPIAGGATGHWVPIDGGEFIYEVVIILPYEDAKGIVPRRSGS
jgi:hypothetical protein